MMVFRILSPLISPDVIVGQYSVVKSRICSSSQTNQLVVANIPDCAMSNVSDMASTAVRVFRANDNVARQVGDTRSQHDDALRISNVRVCKVQTFGQRQ